MTTKLNPQPKPSCDIHPNQPLLALQQPLGRVRTQNWCEDSGVEFKVKFYGGRLIASTGGLEGGVGSLPT